MNEYLQKLYDWISTKDPNFSSKISIDEFASKMETDSDYNSRIFSWINTKDPMFSTKLPENEFQEKTLKKKEEPVDSTSPEVATESTSQPQEDLGLLESGQDLSDRVAGIKEYFERRDLSAQDVESDINIQAAIDSGVISEQDLIDAGYKLPQSLKDEGYKQFGEQISTLSATSPMMAQKAKDKITALRKKTDQELDFTVSQQKLGVPYAFEQSASGDTFVDDVYSSSMLASMNINPNDFDGFLEEKGFKKDFMDKKERGLFENSYLSGGDPELSFEIEKMRMLNLYVTEQLQRDINWQKIQEQKRTGIDPDFVGKKFRPSANNIDTRKLTEYIETEMPYLSQKLKERDAKNRETYNKYIDGEMGVGNFISTIAEEGWQGFSDRVGEFSASTYDVLGMDNVADALRLASDVDKVTRPDRLTYGFASGKAIEHNGRKYLVDSNNQVYDTDSKIVVTQFLSPLEYKSIVDKAKEFGYNDQTFSPVGTAYQLSNVFGDLIVQLALTRGAGTVTSAAGGFTRGLGVLGKTKDLLRAIPVSRSMGSAIIAQATLGASSGYEKTFKQARESGLNDADARELASYASQQMAVLYALTAPISPQTKATEAFSKMFGNLKNVSVKEAVEAYKKMGLEGARGIFTKYGNNILNFGGEGLKETIQENVQQAGEAFMVNKNVNEEAARNILKDTITLDEFVNTSVISFLAGGLMPAAGKAVSSSMSSVRKMLGFEGIDRMKALDYLSRNEKAVMEVLDDQISRGIYTVEAANDLISELNTYKQGVGKIPQDLDPEVALDIMGDIAKISELENKKEGLDPAFRQDIDDQIQSIRDNIRKKSKKDAVQEQEAGAVPDDQQAETVQEVEEGVRFTTEEKTEKVSDLLYRPVTLTKLGGSNLDTPVEGQMYVEGQQVVVEDENGNITEIGNVDEISDSTLEEMGIEQRATEVTVESDGNLKFREQPLVPDRKGIKRNKRGDISRVVLRSPDGSQTVTLRGANAEEAAYQIMLKEAQSPEQEQRINELLEQDEEFQNELRQAEAATQGQADKDTEQAAGEQGSEAYVAELKRTKESDPSTYWSVSEVSAKAAAEGTVINTKDGGALVKKDGDIVGVFKKLGSKAKGVAQDLLKKAVEAGGTKLDNFVTGAKGVRLQEAYEKAGFRVVARTPFNRAYAPDGWTEADGTPDVVAMVYDPEGKIDIEEKTFTDPKNGYDQMIEYRDSVLEGQKKSGIDRLKDIFKAPNQKAQIEAAEGALSKLAPDVKIVVHEDEDSYAEATGEKGRKQKSAGEYNAKTNTIHINSTKANARTVAHEAFHAILLNIIGTDAEVQRITKGMMKAVAKSASPELKAALDKFAANYDKNIQNEERLAELIGIMASQYKTLDRPSRNVIKRWLDRLAKMFGLKPFTDSEVIDVLNTISRKLQTGEAITEQDVSPIAQAEVESRAGRMSRKQMQDLFLSEDKPNLKSTKDVAKFLDGWSKESAVFDQDVKNIPDSQIEDMFVDHLTLELTAWEKVRKDEYISFYDDDIVKNTNPTLQSYAEKEYGRSLTDTEVKLYHLVSAFASPSANPEMDSWKGFDIFDRFMKTGELSGYSDKIATVWETLPGGRRVDTGVPRKDEKGMPVRSKVTPAYSQTGLDKFNLLLEKMGGDMDKAMEWITSEHSYSEIAEMFGYPEKGSKALKENEYMTKQDGGLGVFGMTGAKLGSYILNRFGNFSTVTKDMWYARTMARLSGQALVAVNAATKKEGAIKTPWTESTKEGRRMRAIADRAFKRVGELFNTSPAMIQERIWDFEKRLYEMLGANEDAAYTSDGLKKGIDRAADRQTRKQVIGEDDVLNLLTKEQRAAYNNADEETKDSIREILEDESYLQSIQAIEDTMPEGLSEEEQIDWEIENKLYEESVDTTTAINDILGIQTEADEQIFTFGTDQYDIDKADSIIQNEDVELKNIPENVLPKLSYDFVLKTEEGIRNADITNPVILARTEKGLLLIDGHHRVERAMRDGKSIKAYILNQEQTKSVLIDNEFSRQQKSVKSRKQIPGVDPADIVRRGREEGVSDQEIRAFLDQEGYTEFEMPPRTTVGDLRKKSESELVAKVKKKSARFISRIIREHILDRQTRVKDLIKGIGSKEAGRAANLLVTKAGGTGYANFRFKKAEKDIYGSLSNDDINTLDEIIYAQRIIAINRNREQAGREKYKGVDGYNEIDAQRDLDNIKSLLGDERFKDLNSRAKRYFNEFEKNLTRAYEAGLITEEVYNELKDIEYSPIRTIKYLVPDDYDGATVDRMATLTGMNQEMINRLSDENVNSVIMDSRWLLMTNIAMTEGRVFENRMLNAFNEAVENATAEQKEQMSDDILQNPRVGTTKTGKPIYKYDKVKVPPGFTTIEFVKDGQKRNVVIRKTYASQLLDIKTQPGLMEKGVVKLTGVNVLRFLATSGNPLFIVGNTAVDFANILFLSDVYGKNKFFGGAKLAFDAASTFTRKVVSDAAAKLNISKKMAFDRMYAEFMEHGGAMDYLSMDGIKAISGIKGKGMLQKGSLGLMRGIGGVLSYLGESSEITFRLAVFEKSKQNQIKQFKKDNGRDPNKEEMEDIMFEAAREARETIDFSQGGSTIKAADKVLPYLNAATQGFRKGFDYALNNPGKFASSAVQAMMMAGSVAALSLFNLFRGMDDEDEERVLDILNSVSEYEKANYHIIFTGKKNEEGEFEYYRVKKLPTISAFSTMAEQMVMKSILKEKGVKYDVDGKAMSRAVDNAIPIIPVAEIDRIVRGERSKSGAPMIVDVPMKILNRNPLLAGVLSYSYNYDHFYGTPIFNAPRNYKIDETAEGVYDDRVNQIYKDLAPYFNMSPKRTKALVEKIVTSETTNPLVGLLYSGYDVVAKDDTTVGQEIDKAMENLKKNATKKTTRYTNKNLLRYEQRDEAEREEIGIETKKYLAEQKVYSQIRKRYVDDKGTMDNDEFVDMIKDNFDRYDWKKYAKKYRAYIRNMNVDKSILDIVFEDTPEVQAYLIYKKFGDSFEEDEIEMIRDVYRSARRKFSKKGMFIYRSKYAK